MADVGGQGLERITPLPDPRSTRWWLWVSLDGGFQFARGGRCPSARIARMRLADAYQELVAEYEESRGKWAYLLGPNGELMPVRDHGQRAPRGFGAVGTVLELGPADPVALEHDEAWE